MKRPIHGRNAAVRSILLLAVIVLAVACGKGGGPSLAPTPGVQDANPMVKGGGRPVLELAADDFSALEASDVFTVEVRVKGAEDLYQFVSRLEFDPALVAPLTVERGDLVPEDALFVGAARETGIVPIAGTLIYRGPGVDGDGALAIVSFTKLADPAPGQRPVRFAADSEYLRLIDSEKRPIDCVLDREAAR